MSIAPEHVAHPVEDHPSLKDATALAPGEAEVHSCEWSPGVVGPHVVFGCPRGRGVCGVPAKPSPPNSRGCSWDLTGDALHPTLTPSVNCDQGCGFHGFVKNGRAE